MPRLAFLMMLLFFQLSVFGLEADSIHIDYQFTDREAITEKMDFRTSFLNLDECRRYLAELPIVLQKKGYLASSIEQLDWSDSKVVVSLYLGYLYRWTSFTISKQDRLLLEQAGFQERNFIHSVVDMNQVRALQKRVLLLLENSGYPFASIQLDTVVLQKGAVSASLRVDKGPFYRIDSIRVFGDATIKTSFLSRYLSLPKGAVYQKNKLAQITPLLARLPYLREEKPWSLNLLGSGSVLDLYLKNKRSSQINGLIGFLPASDQLGGQKLLITGDVNILLNNSFGQGERLLFQFQQIQVKSPRLQLAYQQPYLFGSAWGADFMFDGFRKDSSFLNIRLQAGTQFDFTAWNRGKLFIQQFITLLDVIDTAAIRVSRRLPAQLDQRTTSMGMEWDWGDAFTNPNNRKGFRVYVNGIAGIRRIRPNATITSVKNANDPLFDYATLYDSVRLRDYTFRIKGMLIRHFPVGRQSYLRTSLQMGLVQSQTVFRNELFQIGGLQLLRGFDDESIFASLYSVFTMEYRILTGQNRFLYSFADAGVSQNRIVSTSLQRYLGLGFGTVFDTKAGLFNLTFAVGGGGGFQMNLRQMKIHFGYINRF